MDTRKQRRGCPVGTRKSELVPVEIPGMGIRYIPKHTAEQVANYTITALLVRIQ